LDLIAGLKAAMINDLNKKLAFGTGNESRGIGLAKSYYRSLSSSAPIALSSSHNNLE
jgi:hypothetical protein